VEIAVSILSGLSWWLVIMALVTASGPLGLSAFLPDRQTTFVNRAETKRIHMTPVLPVTDTWPAADFSLERVISETEEAGPVNLRRYTVKLLSRYQYISGKSNDIWCKSLLITGRSETEFHMLNNPDHAARVLSTINPTAVMLGLNDNIERDADDAKRVLTEWFQQRWPEKTQWERA
jgi:3-O-alpha-D-mannopyranosyl-alpha-D-mannopyranose xylosylphosphotransferase